MILKLQPVFKNKVWGGNKIHKRYGYDCSNQTGEAWGISGHKHGASIVQDGSYKGKTIRELYKQHPELFGHHTSEEFPILVKIIDANEDLSIQVHPDNEYAKTHENSMGKTESWYILDTEKDTDIIIGHQAKTKKEFYRYIQHNNVESILNKFKIHPGDAFNIYAGTIHAICQGTLLLEVQQSSDVTYRLYDYNRLSNSKLRALHIDKAMDVIHFPDQNLIDKKPTQYFDYQILSQQHQNDYSSDQYGDYLFIIEGQGKINDIAIKQGEFLMVSSKDQYRMSGQMKYAKIQIKS